MVDTSFLKGIIVPVVTPFAEDEAVDESALRGMIDYLVESGVSGLFPAGTQGEFFALDADEKKRVIDVTLEQTAGRVFVMPNTGGITTRESVALSRYAESAGSNAISVITPFFISPTQDELYGFFAEVAEAVSIPVLAYNNPGRTHVNVAPATVARLAEAYPHFCGIKDSSGDLTQTLEYVRNCPPTFRTFIGRDTLIYAAITNGCVGAVAATANVAPKIVVGIYEAAMAGDHAGALAYQRKLAALRIAFSLGTFPVVGKEALEIQGRIPNGRARKPVAPLTPEARAQLKRILREIGEL
jgi:4-hydroxy-tetrahydrodipicolinate synthase